MKNPKPDADILQSRYFHSTDKDDVGMAIFESRTVRPSSGGKGYLSPVSGRTYVSKSLEIAAMYALGGVMMGRDPHIRKGTGEFGWIFEVKSSGLVEVFPDEDEVGELVSRVVYGNETGFYWLKDLAERHVAPARLRRIKDGEYAYYASVGKQLLARMADWQMSQIIKTVKNLAVAGPLDVVAAWRLDKRKSKEIKPDGSNVLSVAEKAL